jgi:glycogen(starch) synthase
MKKVAEIKRAFSPNLVHVNSYGRSVFFHLATTNASQSPLLLTLHQPLPDEPVIQDTLLQKVFKNADWVTACSSSILKHSCKLVPEIIPRSSFIHNAIEKPAFIPQPLSVNPPRLLCLGRLVREKGFDLALPAFAAVIERFPSATLWIAGDGPERERMQKQAIQLRLGDSVKFMGSVPPDEVFRLINRATIVLAPSRVEGFGLAALEAAMMARPVVATRVGGLPETVIHGQTGLLVDSGDSAGMAEAIIFLLDHRHTASRIGQAARHRVETEFSWKSYVDAHDDLYRKLIRQWNREHSSPGVD